MKVKLDIECTPEEARAFFGLPDVRPLQEALMPEVEERLRATLKAMDPEAMLKVQISEELGGAEAGGNAVQSALAAGISTLVGAMVPVIPFFFMRGNAGVITAFAVSLVAHFLVGASKALFTLRTWWAAGLEMTLAGVIVGGVTYGLGLLFRVGS